MPPTREIVEPTRRPPFELERLIGMKFFLAIGALVVVIGVVLLLKLGYDEGWFSMSAAAKCWAGGGFGLLLLVAGEFAFRRVNAQASAGFTAAGLGTLYASAFAAYGPYQLLAVPVAFVLFAACAAIGIALSARARLVSVAILSLIGGYSAPFLLHVPDPSPWVMPAYLITLLAVGLVLSGWLRGRFVAVRALVWWATVLIGGAWVTTIAVPETFAYGVGFVTLVWLMVHAELFAAARSSSDPYEPIRLGEPIRWRRVRAVLVSFSTTAWCAGLGVLLFRNGQEIPEWLAPAAGVAATVVGWNILAGHLRVLRDPPSSDAERLGAGLAMQAGGLLIAAVALGFSGRAEVTMWLAMGVASTLAGRWLPSRALHIYGLISLTIAAVRLLVYESFFSGASAPAAHFAGFVLSLWMLFMMLAGVAWLATAWTIRPAEGFWRVLRNAEIGAGLTLLFLAVLHESANTYAESVAALVFCLAALAAARTLSAPGLAAYAIAWLTAAMLWIAVPEYARSHEQSVSAIGLFLSWWSLLMFLAAGTWSVGGWMTGGIGPQWRAVLPAFSAGIPIVLIFGGWLDERADPGAVCVVWLLLSHAIALASPRCRHLLLDVYAPAGMLACLSIWTHGYVVGGWVYEELPALLHPGLLISLAVAVSFPVIIIPLTRREELDRDVLARIRQIAYAIAAALVLVSTSFEASRIARMVSSDPTSQRATLTIWWAIFGSVLIVAGFWRRAPAARYAGLALIGIAIVKAMLFDLADTEGLWRVASFIGPGLLMLIVAAGYAKVSAALAGPVGDDTESDTGSG